MARKELAQVLNELLMKLEDGRKAFMLAAERCAAPELKAILVECAHDCTRSLHDLQKGVHAFGEASAERGSVFGTLRQGGARLWAKLGLTGTAAVLGHVERQYARIEQAFVAALAADLPPPERAMVEKERARVRGIARRLAALRRDQGATRARTG